MKPLYIFLLLWAVFITGLADGLSWALIAIPGLGFILGLAITFCINATMGIGLLFLLAANNMYHPRLSPFAIIGGLIPGLNVLPFWVGLVIAGIVYKTNAEGENLGGVTSTALKLQSTYLSNKNPFQKMGAATGIVMNSRRAEGRPPQAANDNEPENEPQEKSRSLPNLKSPSFAPRMNSDIAPPRTPTYAKAA